MNGLPREDCSDVDDGALRAELDDLRPRERPLVVQRPGRRRLRDRGLVLRLVDEP